jgi:hypothetical protein
VEQACRINPDKAACPGLWQRFAEKTGQVFDFQRFLKSEDSEELRGYGDFFFEKEQWGEAQQLYEKAEAKQHRAETLQNLFSIAEKTGPTFDFQRFLKSEDTNELNQYASFFTTKAEAIEVKKDRVPDYQRAVKLRERQMQFDTTTELRVTAANEYKSLAFYQLFASDGKGAEASLQRAEALDPNNVFIPTNRAPALLLQGPKKEAAAKAEYQKWKDKPYNQNNLPTYRDAFLSDLKELEAAQIPNIDYAKVRQWLEE